MEREYMEFDVVIVGAGPAGLSAACRLKQKAAEAGQEISVCVVEKGSEVGAHILSGAVFEPRALNELFPDWKELGAPLNTPVTGDDIYVLKSAESATKVPNFFVPKTMHNEGNYIISLGNLCRWLAQQAEGLGVEIYPGFAAQEALIDENGVVRGIVTGDLGVDREGNPKEGYYTPAWSCGQVHPVRRRLPRAHRQATDQEIQPGQRGRCPALRYRHQGNLGHRPVQAQARPGGPYRRLAAERRKYRRLVPLPPGEQPGVRRPDHRPVLQQPAPVAVRRVPALQAPPGGQAVPGRRQARGLRRPGHLQGRPEFAAEDGLPRRRADRLRPRHPELRQDQGQPHRDEVRHARRRRDRRGPGRRPRRRRRAVQLRRCVQGQLVVRRTVPQPQLRRGHPQVRRYRRRRVQLHRPEHLRRQDPRHPA